MNYFKRWGKSRVVRRVPVPASAGPGAGIPELRKDDEDKKLGAPPWLAAQSQGPSVVLRGSGAIGSAASSGLLGSARIAQILAQSLGKASILGRLFASQWGSMVVLAGMLSPAVFLIGALAVSNPGWLGRSMPEARSAPVTAVFQAPESALTSAAMPDTLELAARANRGLYGAEQGGAPSSDAPAAEKPRSAADVPAAPAADPAPAQPDPSKAKDLDRDSFVQKLTSDRSTHGGMPAKSLTDSGIKMQLSNSFSKPLAGPAGRLKAFARAPRPVSSQRLSRNSASARRAMGQLKLANNLSRSGASNTGETSRQYAADAFEQQKSVGAPASGAGISQGAGTVMPSGTGAGAPDVTEAPPVGSGENATPYQKQLDDAKQKSNTAMMLMIMGGLLILSGTLLTVFGMMKMVAGQAKIDFGNAALAMAASVAAIPLIGPAIAAPITAFGNSLVAAGTAELKQGKMMLMIGIGMIAAGTAMLAAAMMMAQSAKNAGNDIADRSGQKDQGRIVNECADQALNKTQCQPKPLEMPKSTVQEDVAKERNATYTISGEKNAK